MDTTTAVVCGLGLPLAFGTLGVVVWFADSSVPWHVICTCYLSFFTAFSVILLVPLDLETSILIESVPRSGEAAPNPAPEPTVTGGSGSGGVGFSRELVVLCWSLAYWTAFMMAWVVLTFQGRFILEGGFTARSRLCASLRGEANWYAGALLCFSLYSGVRLLTEGFDSTWRWLETFPAFCHTLSHVVALVVLALLLGYGLVELPRTMWRSSIHAERLHWLYARAASVAKASREAEAALHALISKVLGLQQVMQQARARRQRRKQTEQKGLSPGTASGAERENVRHRQHESAMAQIVQDVLRYSRALGLDVGALEEAVAASQPSPGINNSPQAAALNLPSVIGGASSLSTSPPRHLASKSGSGHSSSGREPPRTPAAVRANLEHAPYSCSSAHSPAPLLPSLPPPSPVSQRLPPISELEVGL